MGIEYIDWMKRHSVSIHILILRKIYFFLICTLKNKKEIIIICHDKGISWNDNPIVTYKCIKSIWMMLESQLQLN